jgi:hypothetical protein
VIENCKSEAIYRYRQYSLHDLQPPPVQQHDFRSGNQRCDGLFLPLARRNWSASSSAGYSYGFNGKELDKSNEFGTSNVYNYGFRIYKSSMGQLLSMDILTRSHPELRPYQFICNTLI